MLSAERRRLAIGYLGIYDQVNLSVLTGVEVLVRRLHVLCETYNRGLDLSNWDHAAFFCGEDVVNDVQHRLRKKMDVERFPASSRNFFRIW